MKGSVSRSRESDEREQSRERRKAAGGKKRNEKSKNATHFPFAPFLQSTLAFSLSQILNHLVSNPHDSFRTHTRPNQMSLIQHLSILIRSNSILRTSLRTLSSPASAHVFQDVRMREEGRECVPPNSFEPILPAQLQSKFLPTPSISPMSNSLVIKVS